MRSPAATDEPKVAEAAEGLDAHVRDMIAWHFSPESGCPFWLEWARTAGFDPRIDVTCFADLMKFPNFVDEWLRDRPHADWIPKAYEGKPFKVFETGGTTGMPKQRLSWQDHEQDYEEFSERLDERYFVPGANWLMLGPTGPRRLRLSLEHLANLRGGCCYHVDLDPRWVKKLLAAGEVDQARAYQAHVVDQAAVILQHREVGCLFTTPRLLEGLGDRLDVIDAGIRGVFCGGTSMTSQVIRFLCEEILEGQAQLIPTYGNTLMGLAVARPVGPEHGYDLIYHAPQPRAVLRVVDPGAPENTVDYGKWGRIELTTMTREFFMPRFLERDEAVRHPSCPTLPWDGVGEVRPFGFTEKKTIEGVY